MPDTIILDCETDSVFFNFEDEILFTEPLQNDLISLGDNGDELVARYENGEGIYCPPKTPRPLPFGHFFSIDSATDKIQPTGYRFLRGAKVRIPDDTSGGNYTAFVNLNDTDIVQVSGLQGGDNPTTIAFLEAILPYRGIDFSVVKPPDQGRSDIDFWWDLGQTPPVFKFLDRKSSPVNPLEYEIDPLPPTSSTQEELLANSDATVRTDGYGGVIRVYSDHDISVLGLEMDTDTIFGTPYPATWQPSLEPEKLIFGVPPKDIRVAIAGEPCSQVELDNQDVYVRYIYTVKTPTQCSALGFNPCYGRTKYTCQ